MGTHTQLYFGDEARSRVVAGLSLLSAGTPMFFMGEEIVAQKPAKYNTLATSKEDLLGERAGNGGKCEVGRALAVNPCRARVE